MAADRRQYTEADKSTALLVSDNLLADRELNDMARLRDFKCHSPKSQIDDCRKTKRRFYRLSRLFLFRKQPVQHKSLNNTNDGEDEEKPRISKATRIGMDMDGEGSF